MPVGGRAGLARFGIPFSRPTDLALTAPPGGGSGTLEFTPTEPGEYEYYCTVPGHKEAGMLGTLVVEPVLPLPRLAILPLLPRIGEPVAAFPARHPAEDRPARGLVMGNPPSSPRVGPCRFGHPCARLPPGPNVPPAHCLFCPPPLIITRDEIDWALAQVELVLLGAHRTFDPPQRISLDELIEATKRLEQLLAGVGEPLAERGGLRRDVVAPAGDDELGFGHRTVAELRPHPEANACSDWGGGTLPGAPI